MEFKQFDTNFERLTYTIEETGVRLKKKKIAFSSDMFVDFEDIGSKIITEKSRQPLWLIISILFLIICITVFIRRLNGAKIGDGAEIFHLTTSAFFFAVFLLTKRNTIFLVQPDNSNPISFIGAKRYQQKVDDFIKTLFQRRDKYLVEKYATLDEFLPYNQQYNNLVWLYNLKLLTKEQLQIKIAELGKIDLNFDNEKKNDLVRIIGFRNNNSNDDDADEDNDE